MAATSSRTLRLLSLLQSRRHWAGADLAERLEVSVRTLRRDVDRLRELGYPVQAQRGVDGGYALAPGAALPPLVLDDDEAVALAVGLSAAASGAVAGMAETSVRALAKVVQVMPARLRRRVEAVRAMTVPAAQSGPDGGVDPAAPTAVALAGGARTGAPPRPPCPGGRWPAGTPSAWRSATPPPTGRAATARSSPSGWCRSAAAGTSSATTWTAVTGGSSGWTGSSGRAAPAPGSRRGGCRRPTPRRSSASG